MNKLDKNIISSINSKNSNDDVIYRNKGFYVKLKGVLQNFAVIVDDTLFIRMDKSSYNLSKRVFKNIDSLDIKYTVCLGTDRVSRLMISQGYSSDDFMEDLPSIFHLYTKNLMIIFYKNNIDFKKLIFDTVNYFDCFDEFEELLIDHKDKFWKNIRGRYDHTFNWYSNKSNVVLNELEDKELLEMDWTYAVVEGKRSRLIDKILN
tara:strand:- start:67469 stop:68083 length:615 start_codon:yes stop_codon:yes gene_type:complete